MPRTTGAPRPVSEPSSDRASAKAMEMPAPIAAASPTRNVDHVLCVAKAAAKSGARARRDLFAELVGEFFVLVLGRGKLIQQIAYGVIARGLRRAPVESRGLV